MLPKEGRIWKRTFHKGNFFHTVQDIPFCYVILVKIFKYRTHVIGPTVRSEIKCYSTLHKCPGPLLRYRPFNCPRTIVYAYNIIGPKVKCTWRLMCLHVFLPVFIFYVLRQFPAWCQFPHIQITVIVN